MGSSSSGQRRRPFTWLEATNRLQIAIYIDHAESYERAKEFLELVMPRHVDRLQHYVGREPLFHKYKLENEIAQIYQRKVCLLYTSPSPRDY